MEAASRKRMTDVDSTSVEDGAAAEEIPSETVFRFDHTSKRGKRFVGEFEYHVPTLGEQVDISVRKAQYLQETGGVEGEGQSLAEMISYLSIALRDTEEHPFPKWWKQSNSGINLHDLSPVLALYVLGRAYEATFHGINEDTDTGVDEDEGTGGHDADGEGTVDTDVQPPPERRTLVDLDGKGSV